MKWTVQAICRAALWKDKSGQDYTEYALLLGFMVVAIGAVMPQAAAQISTIVGNVRSQLTYAGNGS